MPLHKQLTQNVQDEKKSKFEIRSKNDFFSYEERYTYYTFKNKQNR